MAGFLRTHFVFELRSNVHLSGESSHIVDILSQSKVYIKYMVIDRIDSQRLGK